MNLQRILENEFISSDFEEVRYFISEAKFQTLCYEFLKKQTANTGRKFLKTDFVQKFVKDLYAWISNKNGNFKSQKGFFLTGINRTGKTTLARLTLFILKNLIRIKYFENGIEKNKRLIIRELHAIELQPQSYADVNILLIDDIGKEPEIRQIYGTSVSVFADMISLRYFEKIKKKSFFYDILTSNLSLQQIRERYGIHTYTRIIETMNVINFDKKILEELKFILS